MQTFLPYPDFKKSLESLDYKRLGKQRVEAMQIINALTGVPRKNGKPYKGWLNHPCSVMWKNYIPALKHYHNLAIDIWIAKGYNNNMVKYIINEPIVYPHWFGDNKFHASHRSNLLRKDYDFYSKLGWTDNPTDPYVWLDVEDKWYAMQSGSGKREYIIHESSNCK